MRKLFILMLAYIHQYPVLNLRQCDEEVSQILALRLRSLNQQKRIRKSDPFFIVYSVWKLVSDKMAGTAERAEPCRTADIFWIIQACRVPNELFQE